MTQLLSNPLLLFWILIIVAVIALALKKVRPAIILTGSALTWMFLCSVSPLPQIMAHARESKYPVFSIRDFIPDSAALIVVLGGGYTFSTELNPGNQLSLPTQSRIFEAIRLYHKLNRPKIVCSGSAEGKLTPQAKVVALAALELGVAATDTLMLPTPHDTWEEAEAFKRRFGTNKKVILVTSALHMDRAVRTFKMHGIEVHAAPTNYLVIHDAENNPFTFKPSAEKLKLMDKTLHEYLGLIELWFK